MKKISLIALAAATVALAAPATAADLGGNCCADLEERIAELEATAARKGNRKVKLTVSGFVNEHVMFWDDGDESNVYVLTNEVARSRFRFVGEAKIDDRWSAGYLMEIGVRGANSSGVDADNDDNGQGLDVRHSAWWLRNKDLGRVWVGQTSSATDGITEINLSNTGHFATQNAAAMVGAFRNSGTGIRLREYMGGNSTTSAQLGEGERLNVVKYETPTFQGFTLSASWGEDDMWDIALRYAGEFNGIKIAAGAGYMQWSDANGGSQFNCVVSAVDPDNDCQQFGVSGAVMHVPTGLFVHAAYGVRWDDNVAAGLDDSSTQLYIQAGIERKWFPVGKTTLFGEYQRWDIGVTNSNFDLEMTKWGIGVNQSIDAAAMDLYVLFNSYDPDSNIVGFNGDEEFKTLMTGGRIQF